jgi:diguanylate cyclase (GGDEF)-like protein
VRRDRFSISRLQAILCSDEAPALSRPPVHRGGGAGATDRMVEMTASDDAARRADLAAAVPQIATIMGSAPGRGTVVELLARMLDALPVGVALLSADEDFTFLYCNPVFERWPAAELLPVVGKPFAVAFPRVQRNRVLEVLRETVRTGTPRHFRDFPYAGYRGAGATLPGDVTVWNWDLYPLVDESGAVTHLISSGVDVTEPAVARLRLEQAHGRGLEAIVEVARLVASATQLASFFGRLSSTVAHLVGARRAFFLRLASDGDLVGQPDAHGIPADLVQQLRIPCDPSRHGLVERILFDDEVFRARVADHDDDFAPYRAALDMLHIDDALVVPWRAGDDPIGALIALDCTAPEGFTEEDVWVLRAAAHSAGLVWQHKLAEAREAASLVEEKRRVHELTLLQDAAHTLAGTLDLDAVLSSVVRSAALIVSPPGAPARRASILRVAGDQVLIDAEYDEQQHFLRGRSFCLDQYPALARVLRSGRPAVITASALADDPALREALDSTGRVALAVAPLVVAGELFGAISVSAREAGGFGTVELGRLEAVANLAHLAIANAQAYARQQDMVARLGALVRTNLTLTQEADPTALLHALLEAARDLAGARYAALEVLSTDGTHIDAFLHAGMSQPVIDAIGGLPQGRGVLGAVLTDRRPIRLRNLADHPRSVGFPMHHPPMTSFLGVPMLYQDRLIGSLYLTDKLGAEEFTDEDEQLIVGLAAQAAVSVENARLYQRLVENAATDPLTGLSNRREFERVLTHLPRHRFAVLAIDVDNLKPINDEYGHEAGDAVLRAVAAAMNGLRRSGDVLARVGGDEFAALLLDSDSEGALQVAERMRVAMHGVSVGQGQARISIGVATGEVGDEPSGVWKAADMALFGAKRHGRDRVEGEQSRPVPAYSAGDAAERVPVAHPAQWAETLDAVLTQRAVSAVYQPIVRLDDHTVAGYEALARPDGYGPGASVEGLFSAAHRLGMIRDLDWLSRRVAVASARILPPGLPVFLNVSAAALLDPVHGVDQMLLLLRWGRWPAGDVVLEITERETITDLKRLRYVLAAYREHGFRIALDDVGEGHSTLEVLAVAMPEYVKIARSLTMSTDRPGSVAAIRAAVAFAGSIGTTVIAEGVETEAAATAMRDLGVELGQGWYLGAPLPAASLALHASAR